MMANAMKPAFFPSPSEFRAWLEEHHGESDELWVGFYKRNSGKPSITWPEAVDAALCFGWIDGVRKSIDEVSYTIRFTPRRRTSIWSDVNIKRVRDLIESRLMRPAGLEAFRRREEAKSRIYSYEQRKTAKLGRAYEQQFRAHETAWRFFQAQAPWYRRTATWWVISGKKEETRQKRLAKLIEDSGHGRTIPPLTRKATST
jgi:uncharacterized protein YdeI (YjbR/CyaY-like superfamily)